MNDFNMVLNGRNGWILFVAAKVNDQELVSDFLSPGWNADSAAFLSGQWNFIDDNLFARCYRDLTCVRILYQSESEYFALGNNVWSNDLISRSLLSAGAGAQEYDCGQQNATASRWSSGLACCHDHCCFDVAAARHFGSGMASRFPWGR